jgi:ABC-type sugar transport system permease subunit
MSIFSEVRSGGQKQHIETTPLARRKQLWGWLFISPWLIGLLVFTLLPMFASLIFSFTEFKLSDAQNIRFNGLDNYLQLFQDPNIPIALGATFRFALIALPLSLLLPVGLAALLNSEYLAGKRFFRIAFYAPYMVPVVSAAYIWSGVLNTDSGWINRFLGLFGIAGPNWLFSLDWIYPALNIVGLWGIGNAMLITLSSMQGVPTELYEAAKVDGASEWARFRHITLPMISPVIFYNLVLSVIGLFRYFEVPFILKEGTGDPGNATLFYNIHLYKTAFSFQDMGYGSTLAWFLFLMAFAATLFLFWSSKYWVYYASGD